MFKFATTLCAALFFAQSASGDIIVRFIEGAPKDRFEIEATGGCDMPLPVTLEIDLSTAATGLIFDVTAAGAGVEVFQPFELVTGAEHVTRLPVVKDGDQMITLGIKAMPIGAKLAFTVDVDDTGGGREITVSGSEIVGASVRLRPRKGLWSGTFGSDAVALVKEGPCLS